MSLSADDVYTLASGAAVAISGVLYRNISRTGRTLRRARARIEHLERYARRTRRLLDEAGVPEARYRYPRPLRYLDGADDPDEDAYEHEDGEL